MDLALSRWVAQVLHTPFLDWLMPIFTYLGEAGWCWIVICILLLLRPATRRWGVVCGIALLTAFLVGEIGLKNLIQRPRPFLSLPEIPLLISPPHSFSFPSGHTGSSFAAAFSIRMMDRRWGTAALILAGLIAFSRFYLTVHFFTDILAGVLLGIGSALFARWICRKVWRWEL